MFSSVLGGRASKGAVFADFRLELLAHWPGFGPGNRVQRFRFDVVSIRHRMFSLRNRHGSLTTLGYLRIHKAKAIRMLCSYFARRAWGKSVFDSVRFTLSELGQVAIVCAPASLTASVNFGGSLLSDSAENGGPSRGFPA